MQLANLLYVSNIGTQDKYSLVQKSKKETFSGIKEKVNKKLHHWKRSLLSSSGREVVVKAVGTAIPIYTLSCFQLPNSLLDELHGMMVNFW